MRVSSSVQRAVRWTNDEAMSGAEQLLSAAAVRERCAIVSEAARRGAQVFAPAADADLATRVAP